MVEGGNANIASLVLLTDTGVRVNADMGMVANGAGSAAEGGKLCKPCWESG